MRYLAFALAFAAAACGSSSGSAGAAKPDVAIAQDAGKDAATDATAPDGVAADAPPNADGAAQDVPPADVPQCAVDAPTCATACGSDTLVEAVCAGTTWSCPDGSIDAATCPPDTCWGKPPPDEVCANGQWVCKTGWIQFSPNAPCVEASCDNLKAALAAGLDTLTTNHQLCSKDADCVVVPSSTACQGTCGIALSKAQAQSFADGLSALDQKVCKDTDFATKCGYSTPKCVAPAPACVNAKCVYSKVNP